MATKAPQPLQNRIAIVDANGNPTEYFIRWAQNRQLDISEGVTLAQMQAYVSAVFADTNVLGGVALTESPAGGSLAGDVTINHDDSPVTPNTYGDATHSAQITVDQQGHITDVVDVPISGGGGGGATTLGDPNIFAVRNPSANFQLFKFLSVDMAFTINSIACQINVSDPTVQYQPFIYAGPLGVPGALLASGPQVTGVIAGYQEVPLTTPLAVAKGDLLWIGLNVAGSALSLWCGAGLLGFAGNGGSTVPPNPAPALSALDTYGEGYGFWCV